jgi:LPS-assembly protein
VGRWYYSLLNSQTTEAFAGIEYGRCSWLVRLLGRHFKNRPDSDGETSVMLQFELAGLGTFGHSIDAILERGIYGYQAE